MLLVLTLQKSCLLVRKEGEWESWKMLLTHTYCLWKSSWKWQGSCWKRHNPSAYICTCYEGNTVADVNGRLSGLSCCSYSSHIWNLKLFRYVPGLFAWKNECLIAPLLREFSSLLICEIGIIHLFSTCFFCCLKIRWDKMNKSCHSARNLHWKGEAS